MTLPIKKCSKYITTTGTYMMATIIASLLSVLINPLLALNLSPKDYAIISYYTSFASLLTPVLGFFFTDYYLRKYYTKTADELKVIKASIIKMLLLFSCIVSLISLAGIFIFVKSTNVSFDFSPYAILVILQLYFNLFYTFKLAEYKIQRNSKAFFVASVVFGILGALLALLLVVVVKGGAVGRLMASLLGSLIPFVWCLVKEREYLSIPIDKTVMKDAFLYGYPLVLAAMLSYFSTGYDKVVIEKMGDVTEMGYYAVACQMYAYLNIFSTAIKSTFQPDMFQAIAQKNTKKVLMVAGVVIISVGVIVAVFILFCPLLIRILTAGRYVESTGYTQILALSVITSTIYFQISQYTYGSGLSKITLYNKIIGSILTICMLNTLVGHFGVSGAAWSSVFSYLIFAVGNFIFLIINKKS